MDSIEDHQQLPLFIGVGHPVDKYALLAVLVYFVSILRIIYLVIELIHSQNSSEVGDFWLLIIILYMVAVPLLILFGVIFSLNSNIMELNNSIVIIISTILYTPNYLYTLFIIFIIFTFSLVNSFHWAILTLMLLPTIPQIYLFTEVQRLYLQALWRVVIKPRMG